MRGEKFTLAPLSSALPGIGGLGIEAPGITTGLGPRSPAGCPATRCRSGPSTSTWTGSRSSCRTSAPRASCATPAAPTRLEPLTNNPDVRIVGRAVLRIGGPAGQAPTVSFIDRLDEQDPFGDHGAFTTFTAQPASFFLGSSSFGMTVRTSPTTAPPLSAPPATPRRGRASPSSAPPCSSRRTPPCSATSASASAACSWASPSVSRAPRSWSSADRRTLRWSSRVDYQDPTSHSWSALTLQAVDTTSGVRQDRYTAAIPGTHPPAATLRARLTGVPAGGVDWTLNGHARQPRQLRSHARRRARGPPRTSRPPPGRHPRRPHRLLPERRQCRRLLEWPQLGRRRQPRRGCGDAGGRLLRARRGNRGRHLPVALGRRARLGAATFTPTAAQLTIGHHTLALLLDDQPVRRVDLQVWGNEGLLVGCQTGVFAIDSGARAPSSPSTRWRSPAPTSSARGTSVANGRPHQRRQPCPVQPCRWQQVRSPKSAPTAPPARRPSRHPRPAIRSRPAGCTSSSTRRTPPATPAT